MRWQDALGSQSCHQTWTVTNFGSSFLWAFFFLLVLDIWPQINTLVAEIFSHASWIFTCPYAPWTWGALTLCAIESLNMIYNWLSTGVAPMGSASCRLCSTGVFTAEQIPHISGPSKFKPVLLKCQLHIGLNQIRVSQGAGWEKDLPWPVVITSQGPKQEEQMIIRANSNTLSQASWVPQKIWGTIENWKQSIYQ